MTTAGAILLLALSLSGCQAWANWKLTLAETDLIEQRAALAKLYKECLIENKGPQGKPQCEHYTQALYSLDVRGMR